MVLFFLEHTQQMRQTLVSYSRNSFEHPSEDVFSFWLQMNCAALLTIEKFTEQMFLLTVGKSWIETRMQEGK